MMSMTTAADYIKTQSNLEHAKIIKKIIKIYIYCFIRHKAFFDNSPIRRDVYHNFAVGENICVFWGHEYIF